MSTSNTLTKNDLKKVLEKISIGSGGVIDADDMTQIEIDNFLEDINAQGRPSEYRKLLWTNPSPTVAFAAQTISLNLSDYDEISIEWMHNVNNADAMSQRYFDKCVVEEKGSLFLTRTDSWLTQMRDFSTTTSGVTFNECKLGSNATVYNNHCVPLKIYGIKYERVAPPQVELPTYSTEEQQIGTWIDGKSIYRKVVLISSLASGLNTVAAPSNIDTFISLRGILKESNGAQSAIPKAHYSAFGYQIGLYYNSGNIYVEVGSSFTASLSAFIICEYTKTAN